MRNRVAVVAAAVISAALLGLPGWTRAVDEKKPEFEVASIKPAKSGTPGVFIRMQPGGRFTAAGIPAKFLLEQAYNVKDSQLSGVPSWMETERYDIDARPDAEAGAAFDKLSPDERRAQLSLMVQGLLADRFKLSLSHETKELPVYALVVAKNGPKLKESTFKPPEKMPDAPSGPPGKGGPGPQRQGIMMNGRGEMTVNGVDVHMFADVLSRMVGRIVVDRTGLTGKYDFNLKWTPDENQGMMMPGGPKGAGGPDGAGPPPAPESSGPSIFTALQEQLGLKLESQKAPVDVLVIQHVERPSEN